MKKLIYCAAALATLLFAGSCQRENLEPVGGPVTFTVTAPGDLDTRAYADGENVNEVHWAVYKTYEAPNALDGTDGPLAQGVVPMANKKASVELDLLQDQEYTILFWAQVKDAGHYNIGDLREVSVVYNPLYGNDESRAAFFVRHDFNTETQQNYDVTLVRPFAQINLGTTEASLSPVQEGQTQGYTIDVQKSEMTVKGLAATFDLVKGQGKDESVPFTFNATPTPAKNGQALAVNGSNYHYVAMNYLLVPVQEKTVEVSYKITTDKGVIENTIGSVPVKENYRTNIIGNLLTSKTEFEIVVDEAFEANDYVVEGETSYVSISSAEELVKVAEEIANGNEEYQNIVLGGDIDLSKLVLTRSEVVSNWIPVGTPEKPFTGIFDGNGYTIKNLKLVETEAKEGKAYIGFFGYAEDATIKNVTFENVYINIPCLDIDHSQGHIGAVAGSLEGTSTIENVTVKGDIQIYATQDANGASRVAVVAGGNSYGNVTMKNVHVEANEGSSLIANNNTGALAGQLQGKMYFENCSSNIDVTVNKFFAGGLVGIAAGDSEFVDCHTTGNVSVVAGREGRHNDEYRVGGIAGGWADNTATPCVLTNCSYKGEISGTNADGSVASPLDYMGYVGRGYTLSNRAGSKVIIDGVEFVQRYDNVYGVYTINGLTPVATADELVAALEANEGVFFMKDIKIEPASMSNAYGATGINIKNGQTIDGNGYTLNIQGAGGTWDSGINTTGGLIKNLTVTGSFRGIFINHTSTHSEKVVLENVTITGTTYTISCDQGLYQTIEATNCTFNGWTSFAKTAGEAKFVNCSFGEGNGYKYCRPYSNTEFVKCTFCPGYAVDTTRAEVTFTDCTFEE
ncbi:MAG: hypothetical protein J6R30_06215 [Bacteroidales bacterium]|nr:hypothetical protein [Bacteroidales bacterium]